MPEAQDDRYTPKPSAIDDLIKEKPIGDMSGDEYLAAVRQAQLALGDVDRIRREIRDGIAKCREAASRTKALLHSPSTRELFDRDKRTA